jgi:hypothetical protein
LYAATNGLRNMYELHELIQTYDATSANLVDALQFTLDNGAAHFKPFFPNVTVRRYEDALVVTEVEPIVAYVLSGWRLLNLDNDEAIGDFSAYVQREMSKSGAIHISKDVGMFVAW